MGAREEKIESLRARLRGDPWDAAAWEALVSEVERGRRSPETAAALRGVYEELLATFPTAVSARGWGRGAAASGWQRQRQRAVVAATAVPPPASLGRAAPALTSQI